MTDLSLPAGRTDRHLLSLAAPVRQPHLSAMERTPVQPKVPVLLLLDEFAQLGHLRQIEVAAGQIAGFGVKLFTVLQDLTQLKRLYKESWETFLGNSGADHRLRQ